MPSAVLAVIVLGGLVLGGIYVAVLAFRATSPPRMDREAAARIKHLEDTQDTILDLAYENKGIDPGLADIIIDEIKKSRKKELG